VFYTAEQTGPFAQCEHTRAQQRADVKEGVNALVLGDDKSETFRIVEPFQPGFYGVLR
jgi:hypothetical protein